MIKQRVLIMCLTAERLEEQLYFSLLLLTNTLLTTHTCSFKLSSAVSVFTSAWGCFDKQLIDDVFAAVYLSHAIVSVRS